MNKKISIDEFIKQFDKKRQLILGNIRKIIRNVAPEAVETISYGIPTFKLNGNLVHFSAYKNHIGFYPASSGISKFEKDLKEYKTSKGAIQFQLDKEIPYDLIKRIVEFRVKENLSKKNN